MTQWKLNSIGAHPPPSDARAASAQIFRAGNPFRCPCPTPAVAGWSCRRCVGPGPELLSSRAVGQCRRLPTWSEVCLRATGVTGSCRPGEAPGRRQFSPAESAATLGAWPVEAE